MDNKFHHPLSELFKTVPAEALPNVGTKAYVLLKLLADGNVYKRSDLILFPTLGESMRSALQDLKGDKLGHWLIHSVPIEGSHATALQLDHRHLSGDPAQDAAARRERRKQLKQDSHKEATQGRKREPKAYMEMTLAQKEYLAGLGEAANDADIKKPLSY